MIVYELSQSRLSLSEVTVLECLPWNSGLSGLLDLQVRLWCSTTVGSPNGGIADRGWVGDGVARWYVVAAAESTEGVRVAV